MFLGIRRKGIKFEKGRKRKKEPFRNICYQRNENRNTSFIRSIVSRGVGVVYDNTKTNSKRDVPSKYSSRTVIGPSTVR